MNKYKVGDFPSLCDSSKISGATDIGIPNGPAEEGTRGLLKAHDPKDKKIWKPKILLRKARVVIGSIFCNLAGRVRNPPGLCKPVHHEIPRLQLIYKGESRDKERIDSLSHKP